MRALDAHRTAELRSLAYHRRVAEKLAHDERVLERALERLRTALGREGAEPGALHYARGWLRWLEGPRAELLEFMTSDVQEARDFRQTSPFAGVLSPRERWQLWREAAEASSRPEAP